MASQAPAYGDREVSIGSVFGRAFGTLGTHPLATFGIAFLFGALPGVGLTLVVQVYRTELLMRLGTPGLFAVGVASWLVGLVFAVITQGALVRATVAHSEGRHASLGECLAAGLSVGLPLAGVAIISGIGTVIGFIFLVVPGIILYIMWVAAGPAVVEERLGPMDALLRSAELTQGARWKIFAIELVVVVGYWMLSALVAAITIAIYGSVTAMAAASSGFPAFWALGLSAITQTLISAVWGVVHTSLYIELRNWKDGPPADALAEVFG
ncbi:MAG: hypothetical protein JOZ90_01515 [Alphaproteobacteria bacterium]|nr:hypothetical protein [Alphaproteobacteria bacterium]MBV9370269.1 hypothetical protein [Alphaproteobacteria bacterium]MBV9899754.1 hypothetical protein [Alphaproteobacteria bacterium]